MRLKIRRYYFVASVLATLFLPAAAHAAAPPRGITLSPFEQSITLQPGQPNQSFSLQLTNHTSALQELQLSVRDFGSLNNSGGIVLEGSNAYSQKYGLAAWLNLEKDTVDIQPNQTASVLVTIENQPSLGSGGHYGAIIAAVNSLNQPAANNVIIDQQLVSLVLVDKTGGDHYALKLSDVSHNGNWLHLPSDVRLTFQNPGNVHVVPRGLVQLVSPNGRVLAQGIINVESAFILPESFRQLDVPLTEVAHQTNLPGPYHLRIQYRYDGLNRYASKTVYLRFVDLKVYVLALLILYGVYRAVRYYRPAIAKLRAHAQNRRPKQSK